MLELKGKLTVASDSIDSDFDAGAVAESSDNANEAVSALQFLGYSKYEAAKAVSQFDKNMSVEDMIKKALSVLSKNL